METRPPFQADFPVTAMSFQGRQFSGAVKTWGESPRAPVSSTVAQIPGSEENVPPVTRAPRPGQSKSVRQQPGLTLTSGLCWPGIARLPAWQQELRTHIFY